MSARGVEHSGSERAVAVLSDFVSPVIARSLMRVALRRRSLPEDHVALTHPLVQSVLDSLELYVLDARRRQECALRLRALLGDREPRREALPLRKEADIVEARTLARRVAEEVGFGRTDQVKISTAVSELSRNAISYGGGGEMRVQTLAKPRPGINICVYDSGPGIGNLATILAGSYVSRTGLGLGILGCKRLMDELEIDTGPGRGTRITMTKCLP